MCGEQPETIVSRISIDGDRWECGFHGVCNLRLPRSESSPRREKPSPKHLRLCCASLSCALSSTSICGGTATAMTILSSDADERGIGTSDAEVDLELGGVASSVSETEAVAMMKEGPHTPRQNSGLLDGSDMDTQEDDDPEAGKVSEAVDETESVRAKTSKFGASVPRPHTTSMKIISCEDFDAILAKLDRPGADWRSVVAALDTVRIQRGKDGYTLLHYSAGRDPDFTEHLLKEGVPADVKNDHGKYPLIAAARRGSLRACQLLCDHGADINYSNHKGDTAMLKSLSKGHCEVADWLIHHPKNRREWDHRSFKYLCEEHPQLVVPYLDQFVEELAPQTFAYLKELNGGTVTDFSFRSGFKYRALKHIYGAPDQNVADTALALVLRSPVACEALACKVMRHIVKAKWRAFGKKMFRLEVFRYQALVVAFSISIMCDHDTKWHKFHDTREQVVGISRIIAAVFSALLLIYVERREARVEGSAYFLSFWNLLGAGTYIGIILLVICQGCGVHSELLRVATCVLNITMWINMYQYLQMRKHFVVLVSMMSHMVSDVAKFILLYSMFLFGFSGGFYVLFVGKEGYETFLDALTTVLLMLFGQITVDPFRTAKGPTWVVANLLLLAYLMSVVIVLVNLLIAMMSTSYGDVWDEAEGQVLLSYARNIIRMEQSTGKANREKQFKRLANDKDTLKMEAQDACKRSKRMRQLRDAQTQAFATLSDLAFFSLAWWSVALKYLWRSLLLLVKWFFSGSPQLHQKSHDLLTPAITGCSTLEDGDRWEVVRKRSNDDQQMKFNSRIKKLASMVEKQTTLINELSRRVPGEKTPATPMKGKGAPILCTDVDKQNTALSEQLYAEEGNRRRGLATLFAAEEVENRGIDDSQVKALNLRVEKLTSLVEMVAADARVESTQQAALNGRVDTLTLLVQQQTALIKDLSDCVRRSAGLAHAGGAATQPPSLPPPPPIVR